MASRKRLAYRWGPVQSRAAEQSAAMTETVKRPPGRKDTRQWCRGKVGREHQPQIGLSTDGWSRHDCEWVSRYDWRGIRRGEPEDSVQSVRWACGHCERCSACGRVLRPLGELLTEECPAYPGTEGQRAQAERDGAEHLAWLLSLGHYQQRRPVITGRQGYRRRRENPQR